MKNIITSVSPYLCGKIASGDCKILVKKSAPKEVPFKCYIYCTKMRKKADLITKSENFGWIICAAHALFNRAEEYDTNGKVIGEFICDKVYLIKNQGNRFVVANEEQGVTNEIARQSCLDYDDMVDYLGNKDGYGWHISDLKIYDKPLLLSELGVNRPPQSYMYVEEVKR
jgi:predicted transcriptional regulator